MGCFHSTAAQPQAALHHAPVAATGPETAIDNFCNMAGSGRGDLLMAPKATNADSFPLVDNGGVHAEAMKRSLACSGPSCASTLLALPPSSGIVTDQQAWASVVDQQSTESGGSIISTSSSKAGANSFPEKLASLDLAATSFRASDFSFNMATDSEELSVWSLKTSTLGFAANRFLLPRLQESETATIEGRISRPHHITLSDEELCNLGIARDVRHFVFSYPIVTAQDLQVSPKDSRVADIAFLVFGGYMYFDSDMVLKDVRAVVPVEEGGLCFGAPQQWSPEWSISAGVDRWCPVTLPSLRAIGVRYFSWLLPDETVEGSKLCRNGGFAYIFHEPTEIGVLQARLDVFFALVDKEVNHGKGCPQCSRLLEWSDYNEGAYAGGWRCEFSDNCGSSWSMEAPTRWFCPHCQLDICPACYASLQTEGLARRLLHTLQ